MEQSARIRLVTAMVLAAVFGSGVLLGIAADGTLLATTPDEVTAESSDRERKRRTPMYEQVGVDDQQSARIATIVQDHRARMDALHEEFRQAYDPRYESLILEAREAIKGVLTPEQATEYQLLLDEYDVRKAEREAAEEAEERNEQP